MASLSTESTCSQRCCCVGSLAGWAVYLLSAPPNSLSFKLQMLSPLFSPTSLNISLNLVFERGNVKHFSVLPQKIQKEYILSIFKDWKKKRREILHPLRDESVLRSSWHFENAPSSYFTSFFCLFVVWDISHEICAQCSYFEFYLLFIFMFPPVYFS